MGEKKLATDDSQDFTGININADSDIPGNTHLSNPEENNETEKGERKTTTKASTCSLFSLIILE